MVSLVAQSHQSVYHVHDLVVCHLSVGGESSLSELSFKDILVLMLGFFSAYVISLVLHLFGEAADFKLGSLTRRELDVD